MAAKKYSAGAIFLQVVPVFANVQRAIEDEAKNIDRALGDRMEKSGEKAGERAGKAASKKMNEELAKGSGEFEREFHKNIDGINRALGGIDTKKLGNNMRREVTEIKRELASLKDVDLTAEADFRRVYSEIQILEGRLRGVRDGAKIVFRSDIDNALKGFAKVAAAKEAIEDPVEIEIRADSGPAMREMTSFEKSFKKVADKAASHLSGSMSKEAKKLRAELKYLEGLRIGVDISANQARRELGEINADLERLSQTDADIDVKVDSGRAQAELTAFLALVEAVDGKDVDIDVDVRGAGAASRRLGAVARDGDAASNSFRSFNIVLLAATAAGPALIPVLAGIAGALLAIGPAAAVAGAGLGSVLIGFSGIGDAVGALQDRQDSMAQSVAQAASTERTSAAAVANARRSAARAVESALERQADAQRRYRDSIQDVRDAEEALRQARQAAQGTGDDIDLAIRQNALAIDQGMLDSFDATVSYNAVMADGSATNAEKEQARINREEALLRLEELRNEQRDLAKEKKKWDKEGVNGVESVQNAQDALKDAIEAQKDAYRDLGEAARDVDRARADGARAVADAMRGQAEAAEALSSEQQKVNEAFAKLGPAGQAFALYLFSLRKGFYAFRDDIQTVLLPAVQDAMEGFLGSKAAGVARSALINLAEGFGKFVQALSQSFQGPAWMGFFEMLRDIGPDIQAAWGAGFIAFMEAMASLMTTLAPFALEFAEGFQRLMESFASWAESKKGQDDLLAFLDHVREVGPAVLEFVGVFFKALTNILVALAPYGELMLGLLTAMLDYIAGVDPKILGVILGSILALVLASQIAYAVMNLLLAGAALIASSVGMAVFYLVALGLAVAYLYRNNEEFRDFIQVAWAEISDAFVAAWGYIKPALMDLWSAVEDLWNRVLKPFFKWLGPIVLWLLKKIIPALGAAMSFQVRLIAFVIRNILIPVLTFMGKAFKWLWMNVLKPIWRAMEIAAKWLWENVLRPVFSDIGAGWDDLMTGMKWVWNNVLKPVWDFITDTALPKLEGAFETTISAIKKIWNGLKSVIGAPIKFVLDTIINDGLIAGFNKVAGWVNMDGFDKIPIPGFLNSFASGGIMPGYTPGRDVHQFVSPTAGRLELSGGEAIMRPEFTAAVGPDYVHRMNAIAASGGPNAVKRALGNVGGYFMGGVLPLLGSRWAQHTSGYSGYAADFNVGSGSADYGMPVRAWKDGIIAAMSYIGDRSYGRWMDINHGVNFSRYAHLSGFAGGLNPGQKINAGQTLGYVGSVGNSSGPHLHFEVNGGTIPQGASVGGGRSLPGWLSDIVQNPLSAVKNWITGGWDKAKDTVSSSPIFDAVKKVPLLAAKKVTDKVWDIVPGWAKTAAGWASAGTEWVVGGAKKAGDAALDLAGSVGGAVADGAGAVGDFLGFADGGILPYNGTMKYDNGGYLPPGLTTVVNLTGKPEPVFTNDQWGDIEGGSGSLHYEPHFEGSNLTAEDVAGDLNFTFRRIRRGGKYEGVGRP